ncbi:GDP-L-fucose synthase [Cellulomonas hominis]|uniref:GDP-L-fucose synthase n=1 Tax=Cellulomonas hominis TaxID=156981 RepID=A0A511FGN0_9CELL|nr:GDP-L-fucose synthase [Cellulomonas hominis]MBB5473985.1 GDP-L-fucose synthase [Cellulomonas hominis]NKY06339.1 GDP-L-fucose synthase [Cellulomonas hominis]GEL48371.1 GDP-L-fucose synthase [Cellulomonas hominis]
MSDRVLVTGASGVVGRAVVAELIRTGYDVVGTASSDGDLRRVEDATQLVESNRPDVVVHLAGRVHGLMGNIAAQGRAYLDNVQINTNVIEAARAAGVRKVVAMGSTAVYSDVVPLPMREADLWRGAPHGSEFGYAHAKRAMVAQLEAYAQEYGMSYAFVVSTNLYGPGDKFDEAHGHVLPSLVSKFHRAVRDDTPVEVWGTGTPTRDFLFADDAAHALRLILESGTGVINMATGTSVTIKEAVETLGEVSGFRGEVRWDSTKPDGQHARAYDTTRLRELGWAPRHSLGEGLAKTYAWYAANAATARR